MNLKDDYKFAVTAAIAVVLACVIPVAVKLGSSGNVRQTLVPIEATVRVHAETKSKDNKQPVTFTLINKSDQGITLTKVTPSCNCVSMDEVDDTPIPPHALRKLNFNVHMPEFGDSTATIKVFHSGATQPVQLRIETSTGDLLPIVARVINGNLNFLHLHSVNEHETITVVTREQINSKPWIKQLKTDVSDVRIELSSVKELHHEGFLERTYKFDVKFVGLPPPDIAFKGNVWLVAVKGVGAGDTAIGTITGIRKRYRVLSPSVVNLSPPQSIEETILFPAEVRGWTLSSATQLPEWLSMSWIGAQRQCSLVIKCDMERLEAEQGGTNKTVRLEFNAQDGSKAELRIHLELKNGQSM